MPSTNQTGADVDDYPSHVHREVAEKSEGVLAGIVSGIGNRHRAREYIEAELDVAEDEGREPRQDLIIALNKIVMDDRKAAEAADGGADVATDGGRDADVDVVDEPGIEWVDDHPDDTISDYLDEYFVYQWRAQEARQRGDQSGYYLNRMRADAADRRLKRRLDGERPQAKIHGIDVARSTSDNSKSRIREVLDGLTGLVGSIFGWSR